MIFQKNKNVLLLVGGCGVGKRIGLQLLESLSTQLLIDTRSVKSNLAPEWEAVRMICDDSMQCVYTIWHYVSVKSGVPRFSGGCKATCEQ